MGLPNENGTRGSLKLWDDNWCDSFSSSAVFVQLSMAQPMLTTPHGKKQVKDYLLVLWMMLSRRS